MYLLLIHQAFVSPSEAGGTRHFELGQHLLKAGHRFSIVASDVNYLSGNALFDRRSLITEQEFQGIRILRAYTYPSVHRGVRLEGCLFSEFHGFIRICRPESRAHRSGYGDLAADFSGGLSLVCCYDSEATFSSGDPRPLAGIRHRYGGIDKSFLDPAFPLVRKFSVCAGGSYSCEFTGVPRLCSRKRHPPGEDQSYRQRS